MATAVNNSSHVQSVSGDNNIYQSVSEAQSTQTDDDKLISDETFHLLSVIFLCGVSPFISVIGVIGNIFSTVILVKHGLHKCSNILLFSLAISDIGYLISYNSVPNILYIIQGGDRFLYNYAMSSALFILYFFLIVFDYTLALTSLSMPVLITFERLIAVFLPLKSKQIVTPKRTWAAVMFLGTVNFACVIYNCFWFRLGYPFDPAVNRSVGKIEKTALYYRDLPGNEIFEEIMYSMKIYPTVTLVGCVAIIVKLKRISKERKMITSKTSSSSKTTKTLLTVSLGYLLTCVIDGIPSYLPKKFAGYSTTSDTPTNTGTLTYIVTSAWFQINASWNFFVYVGMNKNFRDSFKHLFKGYFCKTAVPQGTNSRTHVDRRF